MKTSISLLGVVVIVVVILLIVRAARGKGVPGLSRRPRPRHWIARLICGSLGGALLIALGVGTMLDVRACYVLAAGAPSVTVRVPTKPAPMPDLPGDAFSRRPVTEKTRFIVDMVAIDVSNGSQRPLVAKEFDVEWPRDTGRVLEFEGEAGDMHFTARVTPTQVWLSRPTADTQPTWGFRWDEEVVQEWMRYPVRKAVTRCGGAVESETLILNEPSQRAMPPLNPFSIANCARGIPMIECFVTPAAPDDPLTEVPASDLIASRVAETRMAGLGSNALGAAFPWSALQPNVPAGGALLAGHIGLASLTLIAAAILLAQVFTHRGLALTALLAGTILYVAALDRVMLTTHLSHLENKAAPAAERQVACAEATSTFFFGKTAAERIDRVAKAPSTPKELKELAAEAGRIMRKRIGGGT